MSHHPEDTFTSDERAAYQSMVDRGVDLQGAREAALDGVDVEVAVGPWVEGA